MTFLIFEITLLMVGAALATWALCHYWYRRNLLDVSTEYRRLEETATTAQKALGARADLSAELAEAQGARDALSARYDTLATKLDDVGATDLSGVLAKLDALETQVGAIKIPEVKIPEQAPPEPKALAAMDKKLEALEAMNQKLSAIDAMNTKLTALESNVSKFERTDTSGLESKIAAVASTVAALKTADVDLEPVLTRLSAFEERLAAQPAAPAASADLSPVTERLETIRENVASLSQRAASRTDFEPLNDELAVLKQALQQTRPADTSNLEAQMTTLTASLAAISASDTSALEAKVDALSGHVQAFPQPAPQTDLTSIEAKIDSLRGAMRGIDRSDLEPLTEKLDQMGEAVRNMHITDLDPLAQKLDRIDDVVRGLNVARSASSDAPTESSATTHNDFAQVNEKLEALHATLSSLPATDLTPVNEQLHAIGAAIGNIRPTDLAPVTQKLDALDETLHSLPGNIPGTDVSGLEHSMAQLAASIADGGGADTSSLQAHFDESLHGLQEKLASLSDSVDMLMPPDLAPIVEQLGAVKEDIAALPELFPQLDLSTLDLTALETSIAEVHAAVTAAEAVDMAPIESGLSRVEDRLTRLRVPNFTPLVDRLTRVEAAVRLIRPTDVTELESRVANIAAVMSHVEPTDIEPLEERIKKLEIAVGEIGQPDFTPVNQRITQNKNDIAAVHDAVTELESKLKAVFSSDLDAINAYLVRIDSKLSHEVPKNGADTRTPMNNAKAPASKKKGAPGANLLKEAAYGTPDDLKRIKGVGPKLEKMLHDIGVYYFWQVGQWNSADIKHVDAKLKIFKGRIERDEWVEQGKRFGREPDTANPPM